MRSSSKDPTALARPTNAASPRRGSAEAATPIAASSNTASAHVQLERTPTAQLRNRVPSKPYWRGHTLEKYSFDGNTILLYEKLMGNGQNRVQTVYDHVREFRAQRNSALEGVNEQNRVYVYALLILWIKSGFKMLSKSGDAFRACFVRIRARHTSIKQNGLFIYCI